MPIELRNVNIPQCLDNRLTDGGKAVSLALYSPEKCSASGTYFC
jgi:hypothetical protein